MFRRSKAKNKTTPLATPVEMTAWFRQQTNVSGLALLVKDPLFRLAAATLKEAARPRRNSLLDDARNSQQLAWYAGYCDAFRDLQTLAQPERLKKPQPESDEWTHIHPPQQ